MEQLDLARLERDITTPQYKLPEYVQHSEEGVPQVGALSAAAVVNLYESAANAVEEMGAELKSFVERCDRFKVDAGIAMEEARQVAQEYRARGAAAFKEIEERARLIDQVKATCKEMQDKIAASP